MVDLSRIKTLIELAEAAGLVELEVRTGDETIRFVRGAPAPFGAAVDQLATPPAAAPAPSGASVVAPMAGTFYAGPAPGAPAFVTPGSAVVPGTVLCIIESMKMLNEIVADRAGTVVQIAVADGQPVGTGDVLFRLA